MRRGPYFSTILSDTGGLLLLASPVTGIPLIVALLFQEYDILLPLLTVPVGFAVTGVVLSRLPRSAREARFSAALCTIAVVWLLCAVISTIPFILCLKMSFSDSLFEAMAGWTGTGLTLMAGLESLPHGLLFWRTFMQWLGGLGVIALTSAIANRSALFSSPLLRAESRSEALIPSMFVTGRQLGSLYLVFTLIAVPLLMVSGISFWEALNLGLSTISTGGFCIHDAGVLYYASPLLEGLLIPVMIAGALPFKLYFLMYRGKLRPFFRDRVVHLILALALVGSAVVTLDLHIFNNFPLETAVRQGFFCTISGLTCTGLQNSDLHWVAGPLIVITILMMIGGAAGSTSGGIKANRVILGYEGLVWWFRRFFARGKEMVPFRHEGKVIPTRISEVELSKNMLIIVLYVLIIFVATVIGLHLAATDFKVHEVVFEEVSTMSNVGLGLGYLVPTSPLSTKWIFIFLMWIGRLEIIPVLILAMGLVRGFEARVKGSRK